MGSASERSEREADRTEPAPAVNSPSDDNTLENTMTLSFSKEGVQEQKGAADHAETHSIKKTGEYPETEDRQKIRVVLENFAEAYFDGDVDAVKKFLASTYEGQIDIYEGTGTVSDLTVKGLPDANAKKIENGECNVSIQFRDSSYEDMFLYLSCTLVKEQGDWKIQFYGVEG